MQTLRSVLSKEIHNALQKFSGLMTKPHLRNLREMQLGMLIGKSSHLSTMGSVASGEVTPRKNTERYSRTLEAVDAKACHEEHIRCAALRFRDEPVLLLGDGGDMQKQHARTMEKVCKTVDGSKGHSPGKGYPTFAIVAYGIESGRQLPLCHHLYSTEDEEFKSEWCEQKQCYEWCAPFLSSVHDRVHVEDRGCDDEKRFLFFTKEQQSSFITRIHTGEKSRTLCPVREEEIDDGVSVRQLCMQLCGKAGAGRTWHNKKIGRDLTSRIAFQEVRLPGHDDLPLFLVLLYTEGFEDPIAILTDIDVHSFEDAWRIFFLYKKRWEVENFFRAIKEQFHAELFLIRSFSAIRSLAFLQMSTFALLCTLREKLQEISVLLFSWFREFCRLWQRTKQSHLDLLHWLRDAWRAIPSPVPCSHRVWSRQMYDYRCTKPKDQPRLFSLREKW